MSVNGKKRAAGSRGRVLDTALRRFRAYLSSGGLRLTGQRRRVLEAVLRQTEHFDADYLYEVLREEGQRASRSTVYRTLHHLRECGLVREMAHPRGRATYEPVLGREHHDHMLCVRCGAVLEFVDERIEALQKSVCRRYGFRALDHRMSIRGLCKKCLAADREGAKR